MALGFTVGAVVAGVVIVVAVIGYFLNKLNRY